MTLTKEDREWLASLGCEECDLPQTEAALHAKKTTYSLDGRPISRAQTIRLLGREHYLAGISRSVFHYTAAQATESTESSEIVCFDSYKLFE